MDKIDWIKELVIAEQEMEESGMVDFTAGFNAERALEEQTIEFMQDLRSCFVEAASTFNQLKGSTLGNIKIYGVSKTVCDFMLFRNGHKLIFSMKQPGLVSISQNHVPTIRIPGEKQETGENSKSVTQNLKATWGAFGDLTWTYSDKIIRIEYLVRFYITQFVRESSK